MNGYQEGDRDSEEEDVQGGRYVRPGNRRLSACKEPFCNTLAQTFPSGTTIWPSNVETHDIKLVIVPDLLRLDGIQRLWRFMNVDRLQVERVGITDDLEVLLGDLHRNKRQRIGEIE